MKDHYSTDEVVTNLRKDGFLLTSGYIQFVFREQHMNRPDHVGRTLCWTAADIDALRRLLISRGRRVRGAPTGDGEQQQ